MAASRKPPSPSPARSPKAAPSRWSRFRAALAWLRPDLSSAGLRRLAFRSALAGLAVTILAALAHWSATGFLRRGGLDHLVSMRNTPAQQPIPRARRSSLDRGRLGSLVAAAATP